MPVHVLYMGRGQVCTSMFHCHTHSHAFTVARLTVCHLLQCSQLHGRAVGSIFNTIHFIWSKESVSLSNTPKNGAILFLLLLLFIWSMHLVWFPGPTEERADTHQKRLRVHLACTTTDSPTSLNTWVISGCSHCVLPMVLLTERCAS